MNYISVDNVIIPNDQRELRPHQVEKLRRKLKEHGYNTSYPITIEEDNTLVDGGHRIAAAKAEGIDKLSFVLKPEGVSRRQHAIRCNEDGADTQPHDVFDYAKMCWEFNGNGKDLAEELGWTAAQVSYYKQIKEKLHPYAWQIARLTKNQGLVNGNTETLVNQGLTRVNFGERHFRSLLSHLSPNDETDHATMRAQLFIICECLRRWTKQPKDTKGNYLKVTARWIGEEAEKLAWRNKLKRQAIRELKEWVKLRAKINLFKNIVAGIFGEVETEEGQAQFDKAIEALNGKVPLLYAGYAQAMSEVDSESVDIIITSPPYNLKDSNWRMGANGRTHRGDNIGYDQHNDNLPEADYQAWQIACLQEMYRVAKPGASLFYNHKLRTNGGEAIHPMAWLLNEGNPWTLRQEIVWNRGSTHNHNQIYFWPEAEMVYWFTKEKPILYNNSISQSVMWNIPIAREYWHPAPFPDEIPRRCLKAIGGRDLTILDPFAGSCTTLKVALSEFGFDAIGYDISEEYLKKASGENGWHYTPAV